MAWLSFPDWPGATSAILISFNWMGAIVKMVIKMLILWPFLGFLAQMTLALVRVNTAFSLNQSYHMGLSSGLWFYLIIKIWPNVCFGLWSGLNHPFPILCSDIKLIFHMYPNLSALHYTDQEKSITRTFLNIWQEWHILMMQYCNTSELPRAESCWRIDQSGLSDCHRAKYNEMQFWLHNVLV